MRTRLLSVTLIAALAAAGVAAGSSPARAQNTPPQPAPPQTTPPQANPPGWNEMPDKVPRPPRGDRIKNLDFLFEALKAAPDADAAKLVESRIWALWFASGSDTADLLMSRVKTASEAKNIPLALELLDAVIAVRPEFTEAWNRRATLHFANKDFGRAISDIRQVLAREPRHFGALVGLGTIMQDLGEDKFALEAFRRALAVNPHLPRIPDAVKTLTEKVEGRDI
jgi:tetratricopeptide (TPR) repeat protein